MKEIQWEDEVIILSPEGKNAAELYGQACRLADEGHFEEAAMLADEIGNIDFKLRLVSRDEVKIYIASKQAEAGQVEEALKMSQTIVESHYQSAARYYVALTCVSLRQFDKARELAQSVEIAEMRDRILAEIASSKN